MKHVIGLFLCKIVRKCVTGYVLSSIYYLSVPSLIVTPKTKRTNSIKVRRYEGRHVAADAPMVPKRVRQVCYPVCRGPTLRIVSWAVKSLSHQKRKFSLFSEQVCLTNVDDMWCQRLSYQKGKFPHLASYKWGWLSKYYPSPS